MATKAELQATISKLRNQLARVKAERDASESAAQGLTTQLADCQAKLAECEAAQPPPDSQFDRVVHLGESLPDALAAAAPFDVIGVKAGRYHGGSSGDNVDVDVPLQIVGIGGMAYFTGNGQFRVFEGGDVECDRIGFDQRNVPGKCIDVGGGKLTVRRGYFSTAHTGADDKGVLALVEGTGELIVEDSYAERIGVLDAFNLYGHFAYVKGPGRATIRRSAFSEILGGYIAHAYPGGGKITVEDCRALNSYLAIGSGGGSDVVVRRTATRWTLPRDPREWLRPNGYVENGGTVLLDQCAISSTLGEPSFGSSVARSNVLVADPQFADPPDLTIRNPAVLAHLT